MVTERGDGLRKVFGRGTAAAGRALTRWLGRPATITVRDVALLPLAAAADLLGVGDDALCAAAMRVEGVLGGILLLAADDAAGLALGDMLLGRPVGSGWEWGEVEESALLETANIVGSAYLGGIAEALAEGAATSSADADIVPSPPLFVREYAAALMEGLVIDQASLGDSVFLTRTEFVVDGAPVRCGLIFVPDSASRSRIVDGSLAPRTQEGG